MHQLDIEGQCGSTAGASTGYNRLVITGVAEDKEEGNEPWWCHSTLSRVQAAEEENGTRARRGG